MTMREKMEAAFKEKYLDWARGKAGIPDLFPALVDVALDTLLAPTEGMYEALSATDILWKNQTSLGVWQTYIRAAKDGK